MYILLNGQFAILVVIFACEPNHFHTFVTNFVFVLNNGGLLHQVKTHLQQVIGPAVILGNLFGDAVDLEQFLDNLKRDFPLFNLLRFDAVFED